MVCRTLRSIKPQVTLRKFLRTYGDFDDYRYHVEGTQRLHFKWCNAESVVEVTLQLNYHIIMARQVYLGNGVLLIFCLITSTWRTECGEYVLHVYVQYMILHSIVLDPESLFSWQTVVM